MADLAIEMIEMKKAFGHIIAVNNASFSVRRGEIHALVGENGAGKTTLMNLLYGIHRPDRGLIRVLGRKCTIQHPRQAIALGIGMVHQHFLLLPPLTVAENLVLGAEPRKHHLLLDYQATLKAAADISKQYGLGMDPHERVLDISVGEQQRVEILKALYRGAEILVLDEPTAVLTPQESRDLFRILRALQQSGKTTVFISHKLGEVMEIADRITVMRQGAVVRTVTKQETSVHELARLMVGREIVFRRKESKPTFGRVILSVRGLEAHGGRQRSALKGISFEVRAGEIFGIAGVDGNGQTELVEVVTGLRKADAGEVLFEGVNITNLSPLQIRRLGIGHIPEDRQKRGICRGLTVEENLIAGHHRSPEFSRFGRLQTSAIRTRAKRLIEDFDIRPSNPAMLAGNLSGGNAQKVVVAREISSNPHLLVASQPTRGLDVGSTEFIRQVLVEQQRRGHAVLLISADLEEILSLSDTIAVMYEGRLMGILPAEETTQAKLGLMMTGVAG